MQQKKYIKLSFSKTLRYVIQNAVAESAADVTTDGYVQATQTALFAY
jgi:hypothetical protein